MTKFHGSQSSPGAGFSSWPRQNFTIANPPTNRQSKKTISSWPVGNCTKFMAASLRRDQLETAVRRIGESQAGIDPGLFRQPAEIRFGGVERALFRELVHRRAAAAVLKVFAFARAALDAAADFAMRRYKPLVVEDVEQGVATVNVAENETPALRGIERQQLRGKRADVAVERDVDDAERNHLVVVLGLTRNQR